MLYTHRRAAGCGALTALLRKYRKTIYMVFRYFNTREVSTCPPRERAAPSP